MLRKEEEYILILGTIEEVAKELYNPDEKEFKNKFKDCDFATVDMDLLNKYEDDLETIYLISTGWYGIKKIDPGFENSYLDNIDLFADYYGGGCGVYKFIGDWQDDKDIIKTIEGIIVEVLSYQEVIDKNTILICELNK